MTPALVFDMDGVLADTERLKLRAHRRALEAAGGGLARDLYRREMGGAHDAVIRAFLSASGLETTEEALEAYEGRFQDAYRRLLDTDLEATRGARELLAACRDQGRRLALVTSSEGWMAGTVLERLGIRDAFEVVVTADDVEREKPHPEAYRRAWRALGKPDAVAVEDTEAGVTAAGRAGLRVIAVRHDLNRAHAFRDADAVVESLAPAEAFLGVVDEVARAGAGPPEDRR